MSELRLNKALASAGICSRRKADERISAGAVTVNGHVVTELGTRIDPARDKVAVDGREISLRPETERASHTYVLLHKPVEVMSTARDPEGRTTVLDLLPDSLRRKRLYPVGRLDYFSEGLLLLTDDGELTNRLTHPRYHLPKVYEVTVRELPAGEHLARMRRGMTLREGEKLAPVEVEARPDAPHTLVLTLHQGINRQIRRMCRDLGLTILKLVRIAIGPVRLGSLPTGTSRELTRDEVAALKKAVGLRV